MPRGLDIIHQIWIENNLEMVKNLDFRCCQIPTLEEENNLKRTQLAYWLLLLMFQARRDQDLKTPRFSGFFKGFQSIFQGVLRLDERLEIYLARFY
jgi:hypothetical protein